MRYIVPQDYEHRYAAFIKYNPQNRLSSQTEEMVEDIVGGELRKEARVDKWWEQVDREAVFRSYCSPGEKGIS